MKRAFTLIELLVYMAIMGFIIVVAGRVFSDSTTMRIRSQNMIASAEQIGKLSALINEDVSQMGAKAWGKNESEYKVSVENKVYMNAEINSVNPDFSSYKLTHRTPKTDSMDNLVFRKISFNEQGLSLGVREINWYLEDGNIYRSCRTIEGTGTDNEGGICPIGNDPKKVLMGTGIEKFYLIPSAPGISASSSSSSADTLFGANISLGFSLLERTEGPAEMKSIGGGSGEMVTLSGFAGNSDANGKDFNQVYLGEKNASDWKKCSAFDLKKGEVYAVEFKMPLFVGQNNKTDSLSSQLVSGVDHIAVGLRDASGNSLAAAPIDVLLYPSQSEKADELVNSMPRRAEFSPEQDVKACVALTFAFYSPNAGRGRLQFSEFRVFRVNTKAFYFPKVENYGAENFTPANERIRQKENVKAFQLVLETNKGNKGERTRTSFAEGNGLVILTPNNGIKAKGTQ